MKNIKFSYLAVISLLAAAMIFSACTQDNFGGNGKGNGIVSLSVASNSGIETKSSNNFEQFETVDLSTEDTPFFLTGTKSPLNTNAFAEKLFTKGLIVTTDTLNTDNQTFKLNVLNNGADYANGQRTVTYSKDDIHNGSVEHPWTDWDIEGSVIEWDNKTLDFWAYKNDEKATITGYSTISKYEGVSPAGNGNDATLMTDFIVANTIGATSNGNNPGSEEYGVPIHFYHALSAVRFNVADNFITKGYKSIKVRVSGVKNNGSATITSANKGAGAAAELSFAWIPSGEGVAYEQVICSSSTAAAEDDRTFFFIPQSTSELLFTFYIVNDVNKEYILSTTKVGTSDFAAGYIYNYTIGNDLYGNVVVAVKEDNFTAKVSESKSNVKVGLTASSAAYIRVAVIANWYTDGTNPKVYAPYTGTIETNTDDWKYNETDGFYYLAYPILGYTDSSNLIGSFSCPGTAPESPYSKLHLEMNIVAQAVTYDNKNGNPYYTAAWAWFGEGTDKANANQISWFKTNVSSVIR